MGSNFKIRIIIDLLILLSIGFLPWWLTFVLLFIGIFWVADFYEAFFFAFLIDSMYGSSRELFFGLSYVSFFFVLVVYLVIGQAKKTLRI